MSYPILKPGSASRSMATITILTIQLKSNSQNSPTSACSTIGDTWQSNGWAILLVGAKCWTKTEEGATRGTNTEVIMKGMEMALQVEAGLWALAPSCVQDLECYDLRRRRWRMAQNWNSGENSWYVSKVVSATLSCMLSICSNVCVLCIV
jgi:hypothetical protein